MEDKRGGCLSRLQSNTSNRKNRKTVLFMNGIEKENCICPPRNTISISKNLIERSDFSPHRGVQKWRSGTVSDRNSTI